MSAYYIKIIPADPYCHVDMQTAQNVQSYLEKCIVVMSVEIKMHVSPAFVDSGAYLEKIACPFCGSELWDWWGEEMDRAAAESGEDGLFTRLDETTLPCCGRKASLNDLKYDFPCGFACTEFILLYPREQLTQQHIETVERIMGMQVKVIHSRI